MPPRKFKVSHRGGGGGKHVSGADDVKARNNGEESNYDKARAARAAGRAEVRAEGGGGGGGGYPSKKKEESEEEDSEEEQQKPVRPAKQSGDVFGEVHNPNAGGHGHIDKTGVQELTRRQREEIEKEKARRRYEELHKAGKTDEAKADLARLEEVKKRRAEAAAKKKADEEAAAANVKEDARAIGKAALIGELKASMGDEASSSAGRGKSDKVSKKEKDKDDDAKDGSKKKSMNGADVADMYSFVSSADKVKEEGSRFKATDGTIEACRAAEADFM